MASHGRLDGDDAISALTGFIDAPTLLDLAHRFSETYSHLAKSSTEHFLVTPVTALPTGKEKGKFLSIDFGGSNLRVAIFELLGELGGGGQAAAPEADDASQKPRNPFEKVRRSYDKSWPIGDHLKVDQPEDLFAWVGDCIAEVVHDALEDASAREDPFDDELVLGITFSFPMAQKCLSEATLLPMGKGFAITSDLNLGKMLLAGYARHCVKPTVNGIDRAHASDQSTKKRRLSQLPRIRIAAITNDTVATFASLAYAVKAAPNSRVAMGLIVGTGTNATVPMKLNHLHPSKRNDLVNPEEVESVVINTEWTIRGTDKPLIDLGIKTPWDLTLDANSDAPGFQPFEYMTAGRYLGEIVRLAFVDVTSRDPDANLPLSLQSKNAIPTRFLSEVVASADDDAVKSELERNYGSVERNYDGISDPNVFWTPARVKLMRRLAHAAQQRSSALIAAACVGLLDCVGDIHISAPSQSKKNGGLQQRDEERSSALEELVIAYAGGTISQYPEWLVTCQKWIDTLVRHGSPAANSAKRVVLREALDGGIIGAGVLAGMTAEMA